MKSNLEHSALPTAEEIRMYQDGKLEALRSHEIELLAQENPLLADALDGYSTTPSFSMLPLITAGIAQTAGIASGGLAGSAAATAVKVTLPWWHLNGWIIGVVAGTTATVGTVVVLQEKNNVQTKPSANQTTENGLSTIHSEELDTIQFDEALESKNEVFSQAVLSENAQASIANFQEVNQPKISDAAENSLAKSNNTQIDRQVIDNLKPIPLAEANLQKNDAVPVEKKSSTVAIQILHILNYKLADYSVIRSEEWERFSLDEVGLPASFGSQEEKKLYVKEHPENVVSYIDYITQCIRAYDYEKFQQAIRRFNVVLEQYPDDVNAQFYSAMSYYAEKDYPKAIEYFLKVEKNGINTFDEEAMYYHAMTLKTLGNIDDANSLFVKVIRENGFYKENALQQMQ